MRETGRLIRRPKKQTQKKKGYRTIIIELSYYNCIVMRLPNLAVCIKSGSKCVIEKKKTDSTVASYSPSPVDSKIMLKKKRKDPMSFIRN